MSIKDIIQRWKERREANTKPDIDDNVTTDRYLRSLRRQRRMQLEEVEKKQLLKQIKIYEKQKMIKELYGIKSNLHAIKKKKKKQDYLKNGQSYLSNGTGLLKKGGLI